MSKSIFLTTAAVLLIGIALCFGPRPDDSRNMVKATSESKPLATAQEDFEAIDNMHHFMEYICQPSYKSLKSGLEQKPADRAAWKKLKGNALVLAETSALVAERCPEDLSAEKKKQWHQLSVNVHKHGADLYRALGKKDFEGSKKHYGLMMDNCNKCHAVFDNGKHQLDK